MIKALKPTRIVPSHITFYPLRVKDNILHQAARLFNKEINRRATEELIIEGNLLFKHTDMDIRFSAPLNITHYWKWWEKRMLPNVVHRFESLDELFALKPSSGHWGGRCARRQAIDRIIDRIIDRNIDRDGDRGLRRGGPLRGLRGTAGAVERGGGG